MNRRELFYGAASIGALSLLPIAAPARAQSLGAGGLRQVDLLNKGWRFHEGDISPPKVLGHHATYFNAKAGVAQGAAAPAFDDSEWKTVSLPHDFVVAQPIVQEANASQGYRMRGIAWYRNLIQFDEADHGKHIELQFDGIGTQATIWFNGTVIAHNWSGYNSIYLDVTPLATYGDHLNSLVVRVDADVMQGWWYEGGGIYRDVWVVKRNATHITTDGVFAHPLQSNQEWTVPVEVTLHSIANATDEVIVETTLLDATGKAVAAARVPARVPPLKDAVFRTELTCTDPHLWSVEHPYLYTVSTRILRSGVAIDEVVTTCGFRTQRFDADRGFFLNGKHVKLKGVCLHQDHAGVGVAVPDALWDFRLRRLKTLGCNAIRSAHNAPAKAFLDACDRQGFLVMDENRVFNVSDEHAAELTWMVRRDRNHPSIIMWSVFNEEPMQGTEQGFQMVRRMRELVRELDTSRPVTGAMNDGLFTPINVSQTLDVVGFNYQQKAYDAFHKANPTIPMTSSEETSSYSTRGAYETDEAKHIKGGYDNEPASWGATHRAAWKAIAERDFIAGGFVWTGFDYRGEPSPYEWPSNASYFGIMDSCGFEKIPFYIHQAQWVADRPIVNIACHWNWQGREGRPVKVMVCANTEEVALRLNGKPVGRQRVDPYEMNFFDVPFTPGRLEAIGYVGGRPVETTVVETTGVAVALRLVPDRPSLSGDGRDAMPVTVQAVDSRGRVVPEAMNWVRFEIANADILGIGNGDPTSLEPDKADARSLFHGLAQVIIGSKEGFAGEVRLTARAEGLKSVSLIVAAKPATDPSYQQTVAAFQSLTNWSKAPWNANTPDPQMRPVASDNNSWESFRAGTPFPAPATSGFVLCAVSFTPFARVRRLGGVIEFRGITGTARLFLDGVQVGEKSDASPGPLSVTLLPKDGERRLAVVFDCTSSRSVGFNGIVAVYSN